MTAPAPQGAIPNWQTATTAADYLRNCREGPEDYSDRRFASLMGWSRIRLYRARLMAELPEPLFDRLLDAGVTSSRELANIALAFREGKNTAEGERCPHCGGALRSRYRIGKASRGAIQAWLAGAA
jgi:hypothetical protein